MSPRRQGQLWEERGIDEVHLFLILGEEEGGFIDHRFYPEVMILREGQDVNKP